MGSCGSTFHFGKQQSLGVLNTSWLALTSCIGHLGALTPPTSPRAIDVLVVGDVIVDPPMKHVHVKKVVCELPSKLDHNLQMEDAIEGHGY
jgi:hypothetical protein